MALEIKTAAELIAMDMEGRQATRRAARETDLMRVVFQAFVEQGGAVQVGDIVAAFPGRHPEAVLDRLTKLNEEDLIRIRTERIDLAYPFSASATPFAVVLGRRRGERYACCAVDALGFAPMLGQSVRIRSRCHDCGTALELSIDPAGPGADARGVMVWVGKRADDERRACDAL
jgi:hypothetical protein